MGATKASARKSVKRVKELYGDDFYERIGSKGGKKSRVGGFSDRSFARQMGRKGGLVSGNGLIKQCRAGHIRTANNTKLDRNGWRICVDCIKARTTKRRR